MSQIFTIESNLRSKSPLDPYDLEGLSVFGLDLFTAYSGQTVDEVFAEIGALQLNLALIRLQGRPLAIQMLTLQLHKCMRGKGDVVPGKFIPPDRYVAEGPYSFAVEYLMILVDIGARCYEDNFGFKLTFEFYQLLQNFLSMVR